MLGQLAFKGEIKRVPSNKFECLENTSAKFLVVFENNKNNDYVIIESGNKNVRLKYNWHEVDSGKLRICTSQGVFKVLF